MVATCKGLDIDRRYSVDTNGNVFGVNGQKLKPWKSCRGKYLQVCIGGCQYYVHRLVAGAFIPNPEGKPDVAHGDGNGLNNAVSNLRWATVSENMADRRVHRTSNWGSRHHLSKFSEDEATYIRSLKGSYRGVQRDLAEVFGVVESVISNIMNDNTWTHI